MDENGKIKMWAEWALAVILLGSGEGFNFLSPISPRFPPTEAPANLFFNQ
jgi:hypothetical protein